jgi:hypothetical protein
VGEGSDGHKEREDDLEHEFILLTRRNVASLADRAVSFPWLALGVALNTLRPLARSIAALGEGEISIDLDGNGRDPAAGRSRPENAILDRNLLNRMHIWPSCGELSPNHELLLPAFLDGPRNLQNYVRKPLVGREGAGVTVFRNWVEAEGAKGASPMWSRTGSKN